MNTTDLERTANKLVTTGKGLLAADETPQTLTKRFEALRINSTPETRRTYREMLFTTSNLAEFISGVILHDETIRQNTSAGLPIAAALVQFGLIPGIKVDTGVKRLARHAGEGVTEGLDGLRNRLREYREMGARFAKWRAVIHTSVGHPSSTCIQVNAHTLARYAAICQEENIVPIVEPEILMEGPQTLQRCEDVTGDVLRATMNALFDQQVKLEAMLLKPNMVVLTQVSPKQATVDEVATATLRCLRRHAPAAIPGIVFLSGGQNYIAATAHLNAINRLPDVKPWKLSFSFGRALQDEALQTWKGRQANLEAAQQAFLHRAMCVSAAALGSYDESMEEELAA